MNALEVNNISKSFNGIKAVKDVSFTVPSGSVFGLIGRNGAGKTTTIRMLLNIYVPDSGEILFKGRKADNHFRDASGYLPEERGVYKKMKVLDLLKFFAEIKGKSGKDVEKVATAYLEKFDLLSRKDSRIEDLSKGNQQKVQFIATILHNPEFIILDEPFSGLDPINTGLLKDIIIELKQKNKVIILSTHLMDYAEKMCDEIVLIEKGSNILSGNLHVIKKSFAEGSIIMDHFGDLSFLNGHPMVKETEQYGNTTGIRLKDPGSTQQFLKFLIEKGIEIKRFSANDISLQEIFIKLVGNNRNEEPSDVQH